VIACLLLTKRLNFTIFIRQRCCSAIASWTNSTTRRWRVSGTCSRQSASIAPNTPRMMRPAGAGSPSSKASTIYTGSTLHSAISHLPRPSDGPRKPRPLFRGKISSVRAVQILASLAVESAGPSYSVPRLAESLAELGVESEILCVGPASERRRANVLQRNFAPSMTWMPIVNRALPSTTLRRAIDLEASHGSIIHGHGLWLMPNVYPGWAAVRHKSPLLVAPRGMLGAAALQYSRWRKRAFWTMLQRSAVAQASCMHATSVSEMEEIRAAGLSMPVAIIPNGIDLPEKWGPDADHEDKDRPRTILQLGRLHPKKGIDVLIDAWSRLEPSHPDWQLRIVGPSEGAYGGELKRQVSRLGLSRVSFEGPLHGDEKNAAYRNADLFVLATENENFGLVVAEALASGTPVIVTQGAPWSGIVENQCGWWIDHGLDPLTKALRSALGTSREVLGEMGSRGRDWMRRDYSWQRAASDMAAVYRWCKGLAARPECVVLER